MESFEHEGLILEVYTEDNLIKNLWKGKSRDLNPVKFLVNFFEKLIVRAGGKKLVIDFCDLIIMNSSTIRVIISFIMQLDKESISSEIIYDNNTNWQAACFKPIMLMTKSLSNIMVTTKNS